MKIALPWSILAEILLISDNRTGPKTLFRDLASLGSKNDLQRGMPNTVH